MVSGFLCGTSSFPREEDDYERQTRSADSSPKRSRSKNPYSTRGLDKFSSLLAEIEQKRQQIYSRVDPDEISLVRFVYSGDHDVKPIVVKAKPKANDHETTIKQEKTHNSNNNGQKPSQMKKLQSSKSMNDNKAENVVKKKNKKMGYSRKLSINQWKQSVIILPMIFILILMFLVLFGKSFAIMCTSIGWYVIPTITNKNANSSTNNLKMSMKEKDYAIRRLSEKKLIASEATKSFKS